MRLALANLQAGQPAERLLTDRKQTTEQSRKLSSLDLSVTVTAALGAEADINAAALHSGGRLHSQATHQAALKANLEVAPRSRLPKKLLGVSYEGSSAGAQGLTTRFLVRRR